MSEQPKLFGEDWLDHGYELAPDLDEAGPCIIDGAPNNTCTGEEHHGTE